MIEPREVVLRRRARPFPDPGSPADVAETLARYLEPRLGAGPLAFADGPSAVPHGWEAYIWCFHLRAAALPPAFARPLVLRLYSGPAGAPRARHEFAAQGRLRRLGCAVPEPLLVEEDCRPLGGPFLVMERVPGPTLLEHLRRHPAQILGTADLLADLHARLHALPADGLAPAPGPFLDRRLAELQRLVEEHGLDGLAAGLAWLRVRRPPSAESAVAVHLDFHPINVVVPPDGPAAVLDWSSADAGDRHADVATTLLLLRTAPVEVTGLGQRLLAPAGRWLLARRYLRGYARRAPLDSERLRYWLAWAALHRLGVYGLWLQAGPRVHGCKPEALRHLKADYLEALRRWFVRCTGVEVHLP